jgi:hypothetical protein
MGTNHDIEEAQAGLDDINLQKRIVAEQIKHDKRRNELLIVRQEAKQESEKSALEHDYNTNENPELREQKQLNKENLQTDQMNSH